MLIKGSLNIDIEKAFGPFFSTGGCWWSFFVAVLSQGPLFNKV